MRTDFTAQQAAIASWHQQILRDVLELKREQAIQSAAIELVKCPVCEQGVPGANCFDEKFGGWKSTKSHPERLALAALLVT